MEEVSKYRKREIQLKTQMSDEYRQSIKRLSNVERVDLNNFLVNLDIKKNHLKKDIGEGGNNTGLNNTSISQRK